MHLCDEGIIKLELVTIESKRLLGTKRRQDYRLSLTEKGANTQLDRIDRRTVTTVFENIGRFAPSYAGTEDAGNAICFSDFEKVAKKHPQRYHDTFENWNSTVEAEVAQRRFFVSSRSTGNGLVIACLLADIVLFMGSVFLLILTEAWQIYVPLILLQVIGCVVAAVVLTRLKRISDEAIEIKAKLEALRRWLKDFTRLEEAVPRDVVLWNRLLVMAVVLGVADEGKEMPVSPDPMLAALQADLAGIVLGDPDSVGDKLAPILSNPNLFGVDLKDAGLDEKVTGYFKELIAGKGAVRETLMKYLK